MNARTYLATAGRILAQLRADRRTVGLILTVPAVLLVLLYFVYIDRPGGDLLFNRVALTMLAILPMLVMFLVTSVAMLRERSSGTLERLWTTPAHRADLLLGYATAFTLTALGQSLILCAVARWALDVTLVGSWSWVVVTALLDAFVGIAMGLFTSAFARSEFQAVQFMPVLISPQIFLCGLLVPRDELPRALELAGNVMPMSWANDAVMELGRSASLTRELLGNLATLVILGICILLIAATTTPRATR